MDDCFKPYRLTPINTSKFLPVDTSNDGEEFSPIREFRLDGMPKTVPEFWDLFEPNEEPMMITIIWIEDCFVHTRDTNTDHVKLPGYVHKVYWNVTTKVHHQQLLDLSICGMTLQGVMDCVGYLFGLKMSEFNGSVAEARYSGDYRWCLNALPCEVLEKFILQNDKGICSFSNMEFTPSQCRTLATTGKTTHLRFERCRFQDGGLAFTEAYLFSENHESGPRRLDIDEVGTLLYYSRLIACLQKLKELSLPRFDHMKLWRHQEIVSAELDYLHVEGRLEPTAAQILIDNTRQGCGLKGVSLTQRAFRQREKFTEFCNALSHQSQHQYLRTLELSQIEFSDNSDWHYAFLAAWRTGKLGLTRFALTKALISKDFWNSLLEQIALQPSLRALDFTGLVINSRASNKKKTKQLLKVIEANGNIWQVEIGSPHTFQGFDQKLWLGRVVPALQHNEHRERFEAIDKINDSYTRKAILGAALKVVNDRPSLLFALLCRSVDIISDHN